MAGAGADARPPPQRVRLGGGRSSPSGTGGGSSSSKPPSSHGSATVGHTLHHGERDPTALPFSSDHHTRFEPETTPAGQIDPQEHHDWALKMWSRMDRDHSGSITRQELDCEEFRSVLKAVLVPTTGGNTGGALYARSQMNIQQAMSFCLRKADINSDASLEFAEFKSFLLYLRTNLALHSCNLIFALFDLDGSQSIDRREFREIYRFYLGHNPTAREFENEWRRLDTGARQKVTRSEYIWWLQSSKNPIFHQHAPPLGEGEGDGPLAPGKRLSHEITPFVKKMPRNAPELQRARITYSTQRRPDWNAFYNTERNPNKELPQDRRNYFSRPQSLPDLTRYYQVRRGYETHKAALRLPEPRRVSAVLSTQSSAMEWPERHGPGGLPGAPALWEDFWCTPKAVLATRKYDPGALKLRCMGEPPKWLLSRSCEHEGD